jgi:leucyl aminopeptidase
MLRSIECLTGDKPEKLIPINVITVAAFTGWGNAATDFGKQWVTTNQFTAKAGNHLLIPDEQGHAKHVLAIVDDKVNLWGIAGLANALPEATYTIEHSNIEQLALGWALEAYTFTRYKESNNAPATLYIEDAEMLARVKRQAQSIYLARDLINTPAEDMNPSALAKVATELAQNYNAAHHVITGNELLKKNYPAIHTVGRAASDAPRLIDFRWGDSNTPKVTLVGKGVTFDSGGLDIKSFAGMKLMKKDMGGSAAVLALANMIMANNLPVRLRVLIPAVENSVASNAYRPLDIITMRNGKTVEIISTDAEGRLVLADAISEAVTESPDLLIDCATLTGAARVALGTDVPALFTNDDGLASSLMQYGQDISDPVWQLPLYKDYVKGLDSKTADLKNADESGYGGAITAALFLQEFIGDTKSWAHLDMMAWNRSKKPGRPEGGEAMGIRALFDYIEKRFS